eukprot:m.103796 g.103796  ORF g.103796 m.103796 type:complete len:802 (+) comp13823_c0_seq3:76-2481(+)
MVDLSQTMRWEYFEGPAIGSYREVPVARSPQRPPRRLRAQRRSARELLINQSSVRESEDDDEESTLGGRGSYDEIYQQPKPRSTAFRYCQQAVKVVSRVCGDDWTALFALGSITALIGLGMDFCIVYLQKIRVYVALSTSSFFLSLLAWVSVSTGIACIAVGLTHYISPRAIGSGIPEMKVLLKGISLSQFLSFRTLCSKVVGLLFAEGSGLPLGKEGPFVHISSIVAEQLMKHIPVFEKIYNNEARRLEMLGAACAAGVASDFGAPIGGVLFSIEVTSTYFAVRNYWRGFFSSVVAAFVFRLLAVFIKQERTITALFTTEFDSYPFDLVEMIVYVLIGLSCGCLGGLFVYTHRRLIELRRSKTFDAYPILRHIKLNRYLYTIVVTVTVATLSFPNLIGSYMSKTTKQEINDLFRNEPLKCQTGWNSGDLGAIAKLIIFIFFKFFMIVFASSLPIPAGVFVPVFVLGAAWGRLWGEVMSEAYPHGLYPTNSSQWGDFTCGPIPASFIIPGGYAVVGAAAMAGAVTHTISTSVIVFELTGQIHHILPVMIAVLIANMICQKLSPSIYDSIIQIQKLPYIPDLRYGASYKMPISEVMETDVPFVSLGSTYQEVSDLLLSTTNTVYALVDDGDSRILQGALRRDTLANLVQMNLDFFDEEDSDNNTELSSAARRLAQIDNQDQSDNLNNSRTARTIDLRGVEFDPSPFQLVAKTSLYKVHTLFSLLGVTVAFVTSAGRLVGVVGPNEVRKGIEKAGIRALESRQSVTLHPATRIRYHRGESSNEETDEVLLSSTPARLSSSSKD